MDSDGSSLRQRIRGIAAETDTEHVAVAFHDYHTELGWSWRGERPFHAASTIKLPVLLGVYGEIDAERLVPHSRVHVRNRFESAAGGEAYRVESSRDGNSAVHEALGRTLPVAELAAHMITTSSNLATNLLIDVIGVPRIQRTLSELGLEGVEFVRGVEDERAFEAGINNRVTANGLLRALRLLAEERAFTPELSREMLDILHGQQFRSGIPAGLPDEARVAHKTGEISTVAHDAGVVYLPNRQPFALVVLTEFGSDNGNRKATIAEITRAVWAHLEAESADA